MGVGAILGNKPKGPDPAAIQRQQEEAAAKERARLEADQAAKDKAAQDKALADLQTQESKRAAFAGTLQQAIGQDDAGRKKFLKGV